MSRYARQIQLPDFGTKGQSRLAAAHVVVIGAGGLGCPALQYLAGAGVGRITLFDPDTIEESNLHRQPLYRMSDLGRPKAEVATEVLRAFNPNVDMCAYVDVLSPDKAPEIAKMADLVIDAADSFAVSYILSDACLAMNTPLISASVLGQTGYVGGFCGGAPSLRAVFPDLPTTGATCATAGVLGPAVGIFGALQAQIALRVLLQQCPSGLAQMVTADLANLRFGGFGFQGCPEPDQALRFVSLKALRDGDLVIELRDENEAPDPIAPTAIRLTGSKSALLSPTENQRIVFCCQTGLRAWQAGAKLQKSGVENIALLAVKTCP